MYVGDNRLDWLSGLMKLPSLTHSKLDTFYHVLDLDVAINIGS
jgi:hypothetical protein